MKNNNIPTSNALVSQNEREARLNRLFAQADGREETSRRERFVKHFHLGSGRYQAITYGEPVHYRAENGRWEEIDNNLQQQTDKHGRMVFRNRSNSMRAEFPAVADNQGLVKIENKGHVLTWDFEAQDNTAAASVRSGEELKRAEMSRIYQQAVAEGRVAPLSTRRANAMTTAAVAQQIAALADDLQLTAREAAEIEKELFTPQEIRTDRLAFNSEVSYEQILPGVTVKYCLSGQTVKEDIIVESAEALAQTAIRLNGDYDYRLQTDNSVAVCDAETGELCFLFMPPVAWDSSEEAEQVSPAVELTPCGSYTRLRYVLDEKYLQTAVFPITIDPVVRTERASTNVEDTYVKSNLPDHNFGDNTVMCAGVSTTPVNVALIKFKNLIDQRASDTIISAQLQVYARGYRDSTDYLGAYEIRKDWDENTVTWNLFNPDDTANISDELLGYITKTNTSDYFCYFDITDLYRKWYKLDAAGASQNFGVAIRRPAGITGEHYVELKPIEGSSSSVGGPCMVVNYVSHAGLEGWRRYESMSAGRAGTAHVDIFNGNLVYEHPDVASTGSRMPVSVTHYYNSCLSENNDYYCGKGWRMSVQQSLHKVTLSSISSSGTTTSTDYYVWTDGDGTEHYFKTGASQPYEDEEGMSLKLSTDATASTATIRDKGDNAMLFPLPTDETKTFITSITDACGNIMSYTYAADSPGKVTQITDGAGRTTVFAYNDASLLASITAPDGYNVRFSYSGEKLTLIRYSDLESTQATAFGYETDSNMLVSVANYDGTRVEVSFESAGIFNQNAVDNFAPQARRAIALECRNGTTRGVKRIIQYLPMTTKITDVKEFAGDTGKTITYQFNDSGNVVCMFDELGFAQSTKFESGIPNAESDSSRLQKSVINLVTNVAFSADWTFTKGSSGDTAAQDTSTRCLNMPSAKIIKTAAPETKASQTVPVFKAGKHTFSVYVKTTGLTGGGAFARVTIGEDKSDSPVVQASTANVSGGPAAEGWERVFVTAYIPAGTASVTLELVCNAESGTVWFACPQLETGEIPNRVNLLVNADFSRTAINTDNADAERLFPDDWTVSDGIDTDVLNGVVTEGHGMPGSLSGNAVRMVSYPASAKVAFAQMVPISGSEGDVFVVGGWNNSKSVASGDTYSAPCIAYRFVNGSTNGSWQYAEFSREWVGWQFGCWPVVAPGAYTEFHFTINYARNAQTAMFSNMFLHREQFGETFAYDDEKNVTSVATLSEKKSGMAYDDFDNLTSYVHPGAESTHKYLFTYGDTDADKKKHLVRTETTPEGVKVSYTYDAYGNRLTSVNRKTTDGAFMQSSTEYGLNGNYAVKTTDARGNSVTNTINENTFLLDSVTDPAGQSVNYTYDAAKRVTGVSATADGSTYRNAYTYANDKISTVAHNTTGSECDVTYSFAYDALGRKTTVKVGDQPLSTNIYSDDRTGLLKEVQYGNGGKVAYVHDEFDRLTGVRYDGATADRYSYKYGANGRVAIVEDHALGRTVQSEYDLAERPVQATHRDADGIFYRTTLHYDAQNRLDSFKENVGENLYTTTYAYDKDSRTTQVAYGDEKVEYVYDDLGRLTTRTTTNGAAYPTAYAYLPGATANSTTALVSQITHGTGSNAITYSYTYDSRGNITSETRNGATTTYHYDALGQLVRVDDPHENATWVYAYDLGGNILSKAKYALNDLTSTPETTSFTYDTTWKDKLIAVNGVEIGYDEIGNPKSYGEWIYTWQAGRQLAQIANKDVTVEFTYDHNGLRTQKKVTKDGVTTTTDYTLHGKLITHLTQGSNSLHFYYDANSRPAMVNFNGEKYTYVHNLQGDIVAILDNAGTIVVEYSYDAWGRIIATTGSKSATLGKLNPFRYRGYVYDEETGMYYLRNRYYNPACSRFINSDFLVFAHSCSHDNNMFAYCANSTVTRSDPSGQAWETILDIISLGFSVAEVIANPYDPMNWVGLAGDVIDLVPIVTGVGETVRSWKVVKKTKDAVTEDIIDVGYAVAGDGVRIADRSGNAIEFGKATDFTPTGHKEIAKLDHSSGFTRSEKGAGTTIHTQYKDGQPGHEYTKEKGIRPDYYDETNNIICELKPFNVRSAKRAAKQLQRYNSRLGGNNILRMEFY